MPLEKRKWRHINISTNGIIITVRISDNLTILDMVQLFYAVLEKVPDSKKAIELAIEKHEKNNP